MCFGTEPKTQYYYHEEVIPVRRHYGHHHHAHGHHHHHHGHHHHHHSHSRSRSPRASYTSVSRSRSPRASTSSYRVSQPVLVEQRTTQRYV